jgi:hypothetical protein
VTHICNYILLPIAKKVHRSQTLFLPFSVLDLEAALCPPATPLAEPAPNTPSLLHSIVAGVLSCWDAEWDKPAHK